VLVDAGGRLEPQFEVAGLGRAAAAFVANGRPYTYAENVPLPIVPDADFEHGLGLVAPERVTRAALVPTIARLLTGRARGPVYGHDLDRIEIACDRPLPLHVDGEDLGDVESAVFEAERAAVSVLT
jgi:diacylglycerol kinase family enzyme